jgi:phage shock protein PspC (stress-responsive transcriptional regulator)
MNHPDPARPDPTLAADRAADPAAPDPAEPAAGATRESAAPTAPGVDAAPDPAGPMAAEPAEWAAQDAGSAEPAAGATRESAAPTAPTAPIAPAEPAESAAPAAGWVEPPAEESAEPRADSPEPLAADSGGIADGQPLASGTVADAPVERATEAEPVTAEFAEAEPATAELAEAEPATAELAEAEPATAEVSAPAGSPAGSPVGDLPAGDVPAGDVPAGHVPARDITGGLPAGDTPAGEQPTVGAPGGATTAGAAAGGPAAAAAAAGLGGATRVGDVPPGAGDAAGSGGPGPVPPGGGVAGAAWGPFAGRRLTRSTQRKVVAGVAGGLGEYTGVDPVLFRVLFAVLTLFGGSGILLYAVGWLFLPADDQQVSPAESVIHRGPGGSTRARDAAAAGALIVAGLVLAGVLAVGDARDLALVLVIVGGAFFLVRNLPERRAGGPPLPVAPEPPPAPYETPLPTYQPAPAYQTPVYQPGPAATATLPPLPAPAPPAKPDRTRQHSILGLLTLSALLVVLGVAAALEAGGVIDPEPDDLLALAVGTLGAGLLVGTWIGRARWLVWLGLPLLIPLIVLSTSDVSLKGGAGDRRYAPVSAAEIEPEYRLGVGSLRLDLTDVDLSEQLVRTKLSAGVGDIEVIVPRDADVSVDGRAGIGAVDLFGEETSGTSATRSTVDHGPAGDGTIDLTLDLDVSIGKVEVLRASA